MYLDSVRLHFQLLPCAMSDSKRYNYSQSEHLQKTSKAVCWSVILDLWPSAPRSKVTDQRTSSHLQSSINLNLFRQPCPFKGSTHKMPSTGKHKVLRLMSALASASTDLYSGQLRLPDDLSPNRNFQSHVRSVQFRV